MGSIFDYISIPKASEFLGVSERSIYTYIKRGYLRTEKQANKTLVYREDVTTLKELRSQKELPYPLNKKTMARLESRVQMLEQQMEVVLRMLDLRHEPLNLSASELYSLYTMAQYHLEQQWSPQEEKVWVDTFIRIRLEDFEQIIKFVEDGQPWRPFYQLCRAMLQTPCESSHKLQLNAGKNNLEKIAYVWATTQGEHAKALDKILKKDDKAVRKIVRKRKPKEEDENSEN